MTLADLKEAVDAAIADGSPVGNAVMVLNNTTGEILFVDGARIHDDHLEIVADT